MELFPIIPIIRKIIDKNIEIWFNQKFCKNQIQHKYKISGTAIKLD